MSLKIYKSKESDIKASYWKGLNIICMCLLVSSCTNLFFQPIKQHLASPEQYGIEYENIFFKSKGDINLHGWWFPAILSSGEVSRGSILFLHGNGDNISTHSGLIYWLTQYQYDVFIFDYRGYGYSQGESEISGVLADIGSARKYVESRNQQQPFFIIGHSLGSSLGIVNLAKNGEGVDGAIFISPFSDYKKVAREMMSNFWLTWPFQWPMSMTVSAEYNPIDYVAQLPGVPKLFIYSSEDRVIAPEHVKDLYIKAPAPKFIAITKGQHNEVFSKKETQKIILQYLNSWSSTSRLSE